jgi:hypothetical protein
MKKVWICIILFATLFNLIDAILTLYAVNKGAEEANPIMKFALNHGFFLEVKILISFLFFLALIRINSLPIKMALLVNLIAYFAVTVYHILYLKIL